MKSCASNGATQAIDMLQLAPKTRGVEGGALTWVLEVATIDVYGRLFGDGGGKRSRCVCFQERSIGMRYSISVATIYQLT